MSKKDKYDIDFISTTTKLPWADKIAVSLNSGFAFNLGWVIFAYYLMFFYTDVVGISPAVAGTIMLVARLLDVITDPLIGYLIDNVCLKWGRYRSWMFIGVIPLAICMVGIFTCLNGLTMGAKIAWAGIAYSLYGAVGATATYSPFTGMVMNMTKNPQERALISSIQGMFNGLANVAAATAFISLVRWFNNGNEAAAGGYTFAAVIAAAVIAACAIWVIIISKKYEFNKDGTMRAHILESTHDPLLGQLKHLFTNRLVVCLILGQILFQIMLAIRNGVMVYFFQYYWNLEAFYVKAVLFNTIAIAVGALLLKPLIKLFGDANRAYKFVIVVNIILFAAMYFMVKMMGSDGSAASIQYGLLFGIFIFNGLALGSYTSFATILCLNAVDHSGYVAGKPQAGLIHASYGLSITLGSALGGFVFGNILSASGYIANQAQSAGTLNALLLVMFIVPAVFALAHLIIQMFWNVDDKQIAKELQEMKDRGQELE